MGAITRGAFAVLVLAGVLSTFFVAWFEPAQATQSAATASGRQALLMARATASPLNRVPVTPLTPIGRASAAAPAPEPVVTVTVTITPTPTPKPTSAQTSAPTSTVPSPSATRVTPKVGYLAQRGRYGATSTVRELDAGGMASRLTHVNYAFANIDPVTLTCVTGVTRPPAPDPEDPDQGDGAGDAWADYLRGFSAAESLDGVADPPDTPLAGNFNQLKKLKARHPGLKVLISIGGWTYSKYFSDAARTSANRQRFVKSCLDAYIRGDLPPIGGRGGPRSAEGVFDGVDVDWEWPGSEGHLGNHVEGDDRRNLTALLAEFRAQLDALGEATGRHYLLTAYVPSDRAKLDAGFDLGGIRGFLDFTNTQGASVHAVRDGAVLL